MSKPIQSIETKLANLFNSLEGSRIVTEITNTEAKYISLCLEIAAKVHPSILKTHVYNRIKEVSK